MFNDCFFPTPVDIIRGMIAPYKTDILEGYVLEPSAGKGNIVDYIVDRIDSRYSYRKNHKGNIHCIEINPELQDILRGKGYKVICDDFMAFNGGGIMYDLIVMNPPFDHAEDHFLHAWEILRNGDLVSVFPTSALSNPYSEKRKLILKIIMDHSGTIEDLGPAFEDSERKTSVNVSVIRISKKTNTDNIFNGVDFDHERVNTNDPFESQNQLARHDTIKRLVDAYQATIGSFDEAVKALRELSFYGSTFGRHFDGYDDRGNKAYASIQEGFCQIMSKLSLATNDRNKFQDQYKSGYNEFSHGLKTAAWETVFSLMNVDKHMTKSVKESFVTLRDSQKDLEFSEKNIKGLLDTIIMSSAKIGEAAVLEAFDLLTKYHKENRVYFEGWKTNDCWRVNKKFILPNVISNSFGFSINYYFEQDLNDVDRGLCALSGKNYDEISTIVNSITTALKAKEFSCESEFFTIRMYKKGTAHFLFKDLDLWEKFNTVACKGKKWLPDTVK